MAPSCLTFAPPSPGNFKVVSDLGVLQGTALHQTLQQRLLCCQNSSCCCPCSYHSRYTNTKYEQSTRLHDKTHMQAWAQTQCPYVRQGNSGEFHSNKSVVPDTLVNPNWQPLLDSQEKFCDNREAPHMYMSSEFFIRRTCCSAVGHDFITHVVQILDDIVPTLVARAEAQEKRARAAAKVAAQLNSVVPDDNGHYGRSRRQRTQVACFMLSRCICLSCTKNCKV